MTSTSVAGRSEQYLEIKDYELQQGRNITYSDILSRQKVCVIGAYVAQELFGSAEKALGDTLKVGGYAYKVVGVAEIQDEDDMSDGGTDDFVWLPYTASISLARSANINSYTFTVADTDDADEAKTLIENFLFEIFKDDDYYRVSAMSEMLDSLNEQIAMMSGMLGGIAGISLLVAGVGVMNIMLVSVTEAAVTSSLGGVIGILIGCGATAVVGAAIGISATPTFSAIVISFSVSVGIGLLFGYMPASRAANLNPIDALRSE